MTVIFAALGAAFAWLVVASWKLHQERKPKARSKQWRWQRRRKQILIASWVLFVAACVFLVAALYCYAQGWWASWPIVALWYVKTPAVLSSAAAFLLAAWAVFEWKTLKRFPAWLYDITHGKPQASAGRGDASTSAKGPVKGIVSIVGIAAVTLIGAVTVAIFFPELLLRVETIKLAGFEARFATTASHSAIYRRGLEEAITRQPLANSIGGYVEYEKIRKLDLAAQTIVSARWRAPEAERAKARAVVDAGDRFLSDFALPLGKVLHCYTKEFDVRDTDARYKLVRVANEWTRVFKGHRDRFYPAVQKTVELIRFVDSDLADRESTCNNAQWLKRYAIIPKPEELSQEEIVHLADIRRNPAAIAFISQLNLAAKRPSDLVDFMNEMAKGIDDQRGTLVAQSKFYKLRYDVKFADDERSTELIADLRRALTATEEIIRSVDQCRTKDIDAKDDAFSRACKKVRDGAEISIDEVYDSFSRRRVGIINNILYALIWDWLNGRSLDAQQILELEGTPAGGHYFELSKWLMGQSVSALRDRAVPDETLQYVAGIYDTLAMREIALGALKDDLSPARCARAKGALARAKDIAEDKRIADAHSDLLESVCRN